MATRNLVETSRDIESHSAGAAVKGLHACSGNTPVGDIEIDEPGDSKESFKHPNADDGEDDGLLRQVLGLNMRGCSSQRHNSEDLMRVQEDLVKRMTNDGGALDQDDEHGNCSCKTELHESIRHEDFHYTIVANGVVVVDEPSGDVDDRLENNHAPYPPVEEVESVERDR